MAGDTTRWTSSCAAVAGRSHEREGKPCQDYAASLVARGVHAVALADGAGSADFSEIGASIAVRGVLHQLCHGFEKLWASEVGDASRGLVHRVRALLDVRAGDLSTRREELASTLLFTAVKDERFIAGHLGDGVIGGRRKGIAAVLSHPQQGEHINETVFTTCPGAAAHLRLLRGHLEDIDGFILMSDGSAESLYERRVGKLAGGVPKLWEWLATNPADDVSAALGSSLRRHLRARTGDDCSVALLRRLPEYPLTLSPRAPEFKLEGDPCDVQVQVSQVRCCCGIRGLF